MSGYKMSAIEMKNIEHYAKKRFGVWIRATLTVLPDAMCGVHVSNISLTGVQFTIDQSKLSEVLPGVTEVDPSQSIALFIQIHLPEPYELVEFNCDMVYLKKINEDQYVVGCRFQEFEEQNALYLARYIYSLPGD